MTAETTQYDTPHWRAERNRRLHEWVQHDEAESFLLDYGLIAEVWDDLIDGDPVHPNDIHRAFMAATVRLPCNNFFVANRHTIMPLFVTGINAWLDANELEKLQSENAKAFAYVLRDWYMELVSLVIYLTRGWDYMRSVSMEVREFFTRHETLEQYKEKLK